MAARKEKRKVDKRNAHRSEKSTEQATEGVTLGEVGLKSKTQKTQFPESVLNYQIKHSIPDLELVNARGGTETQCYGCSNRRTNYIFLFCLEGMIGRNLMSAPINDLPSPCPPLLSSPSWDFLRGKLLEDFPLQPVPRT